MVNWIWLGMILFSFWFAALTGRMKEVTEAAFSGAQTGVTVCFGLISVLVLWMGLMRIAEDAGLVRKLSVLIGPVVRRLFPDVPPHHPAMGYILSNMSANLLGLGNAATPMGIRAMQELQKLNPDPQTATPAMCTLLALNTSSITLVPTTLIAIRLHFGSANPADIIGSTLLATAVATGAAIAADRWYRSRSGSPPAAANPAGRLPPASDGTVPPATKDRRDPAASAAVPMPPAGSRRFPPAVPRPLPPRTAERR
jgi:spore maturation protein A